MFSPRCTSSTVCSDWPPKAPRSRPSPTLFPTPAPFCNRTAKRDLGWDRDTIRKGTHELDSGLACLDNYGARRRKRTEEHLPNLLADIRAVVAGQSQTDPSFKMTRLYCAG